MALLVHVHLRYAISTSIFYDDAHNANVAKNLAFGFGYSTSYHEIIPFNPEASTGPTIILPAAALVRVFGNQYWVPNAAISICIGLAFTLFLFTLRGYLSANEFLVAAGLIAIGLVLYPDEIGLLGEVPGALLASAAVLIVCRGRYGPFASGAAGTLLGLAVLCKLIIALVFVPALLYLLFYPDKGAGRRSRSRIADAAVFGFATVAPFMIWQVCQVLLIGGAWQDVIAMKAGQLSFFAKWSGIGEVRDAGSVSEFFISKLARNGRQLPGYFGGWLFLVFGATSLLFSIGAATLAFLRRRERAPLPGAVLVMSLAAVTHFGWWLAFSREGWYRHLLPGVLYFMIAAVLAVIAVARTSRAGALVSVTLLMLSWLPLVRLRSEFLKVSYRVQPRVAALLATRDELVKLQRQSHPVMAGYAWWVTRDLEYVLPSVGNFKDVLRLPQSELGRRPLILVRNEFFNWEKSPVITAFANACDHHVLFRADPFVVSRCPGLWKLVFPWAESEPRRLKEEQPFKSLDGPGGVVTLAHPTSALAVTARAGASEIHVEFGILDEAWQSGKTDGVEFRISTSDARGLTQLWSRAVAPRERIADRGRLTATIALPKTFEGGEILAETLPGRSADWDWAFWGNITVK
jgi:hypothetical protein